MKGYWDNQKATNDAFADDWFKTGDLGMLNEEGYLVVKGRCKDIIISGGENIYPKEIEEILC